MIKSYKVTSQYKKNYFPYTVTDFNSFLFLFFWKKPKSLLVCKFIINSPLVDVQPNIHMLKIVRQWNSQTVWPKFAQKHKLLDIISRLPQKINDCFIWIFL